MPSVSSSQQEPSGRREHQKGSSSSGESKANKSSAKTGGKTGTAMKDLTIEIPSSMSAFLDRKEKDRYTQNEQTASPEENPEDEGAAEEWLISPRIASRRKERREMFASSAAAFRRSTYENYESPAHQLQEARSSVSTPGTIGVRERMQRELLKQEFHKRMQRSGVLLEVETNLEEPTKNKIQKEISDATTKDKRQLRRSSSERQLDRPQPIRRFSSAMEADRTRDFSLTRQKVKTQTPASPTSPNRKKKSSTNSSKGTGDNAVLLRLSRQVRLGRRGELPQFLQRRTNRIILHIYDLIAMETIVLLPFGYDFPIGKVFNVLNSGLHSLGTGAYHVGVEVNGIEYAYGANSIEGSSGVFTCMPKSSPGYQYRTSIDLGEREVKRKCWVSVSNSEKDAEGVKVLANGSSYREVETFVDGRTIIREMASEYMGKQYDLLRKNCCTFAMDVCRRLGVQEEEVPSWFRNLADAGAKTKDAALSTFEPIQMMLSACDHGSAENIIENEGDCGFEVIAQGKKGALTRTEMEIVKVVEAADKPFGDGESSPVGFRRTLSWTY